jgi:hypothetical protein
VDGVHYSEPQPDVSVSAPPNRTTTHINNNNPRKVKPQSSLAENEIRSMLRILRTSQTAENATSAIQDLYYTLGGAGGGKNIKGNRQIAEAITRWNGCGAILMAVKDWSEENEFSSKALRSLVLITANVPKSKQIIVELGGIRTMLLVAERHSTDYFIRSNAVGLLHNISSGVEESIKRETASEECIDLVIQTMKHWCSDVYTQKRGMKYFLKIGRVDDSQITLTLHKKRVGILFLNAMDKFRNSNPEVKKIAQDALMMYASS